MASMPFSVIPYYHTAYNVYQGDDDTGYGSSFDEISSPRP